MTEKTIILPPNPGGNGTDTNYRLTVMVPKRRFLTYLQDRWWVVLVCLVLTLGTVFTYETIRTETYDSYAQLLLGDVQVNVANLFTEDSINYFGTQIELLKGARLQSAAYAKAGQGAAMDEKNRVKLDIVRPMNTSILQLQATGADPLFTQRFLQALIDEYRTFKKDSRNSTSEELVNSLNEELNQQKKALEAVQDKWAEFQKTNNVAVLAEEGKSAGLYLADLKLDLDKYGLDRGMLSNAVADAQAAAQIADKVAAESATNTATSPSDASSLTNEASLANITPFPDNNVNISTSAPSYPVAHSNAMAEIDDAELKSAKIELQMLLAEKNNRDKVQAVGGPRKYNEAIDSLKKRVAFLEDQNFEEKKRQLHDLETRLSLTTADLPGLTAHVLDINERLSEAERLKNNVAREQAYYDHLLGMFQNVDLGRNVQQERLSVLEAPTEPLPTRRNLPLRMALAAVAGVALSMGIVFGWHLVDDRFASFHDVKDQFGEEILGLVPQIRVHKSKPQDALLLEGDSRYAYRESFRHLRSALLLSSEAEKRPQTLLFTGVAPGEGKTTIAINLARTLARSGLRIVLVDADVHVGGIHRLLGVQDTHQPGLLDYLRGEVETKAIIRSTDIPGLTYISCGTGEEHAEGLFMRPRLGDLMKELRENHDFVIIDGAPILAADDTALLVPHADSVVLVVRPFYTRSQQLRVALSMLYQRQAKQIFLVFNRARAEDMGDKYSKNGRAYARKNGASRQASGKSSKSDRNAPPPPPADQLSV